jgi:hypothetical protein
MKGRECGIDFEQEQAAGFELTLQITVSPGLEVSWYRSLPWADYPYVNFYSFNRLHAEPPSITVSPT